MRVHCLGSGGYHPNERRHTACYYLPEQNLLLDAGTGAYRLADRLVSTELTIVLTHAHLDHICGLTFLLVPMLLGKLTSVEILAEQKTIDAVEKHLFDPAVFPMRPDFKMTPITAGDEFQLGEVKLSTCPLPLHPGGSLGVKLTSSRAMFAYITDTVTSEDYIPFIKGANLLLHECYFPDEKAEWCEPAGHSHTTAVASIAKAANVQQMGLIHVDPQCEHDDPIGIEVARKIFPRTVMVEDLDIFQV
ncbi:MBL fold metallo-hydrolase [Lacunimicrobium album]